MTSNKRTSLIHLLALSQLFYNERGDDVTPEQAEYFRKISHIADTTLDAEVEVHTDEIFALIKEHADHYLTLSN